MGLVAYKETKVKDTTRNLIEQANAILEDLASQDVHVVTLRQLYYQFVGKALLPNNPKSYKLLGSAIGTGRLVGLVDWDSIEDRGREPQTISEWDSLGDLVEGALRAYRLPRFQTQPRYVELWVEKAALAAILEPLARQFHVTLMVNKGYSSLSAMRESANRFTAGQQATLDTESPVLLYIGDHDPSGEDMVRDIQDRMDMFEAPRVEVRKVALTTAQVRQYNPPPNAVKITDARSEGYRQRHGDSCWEVDALNPAALRRIITNALQSVVDMDAMKEWIDREEKDKKELRKAAEKIMKKGA